MHQPGHNATEMSRPDSLGVTPSADLAGPADEERLARMANYGFLAILIVAVSIIVFVAHKPALTAEALSFDDTMYLTDNPLVQNPSWRNAWRFLSEVLEPSTVAGYYQPLAMISLMLDSVVGGTPYNLVPFHQTSLALHIGVTALIIVLLYMLFGRPLPAALAALLFGVHPLTVEPIPWIGERKTLLAAFFAVWCLILYVRYARTGGRIAYAGCAIAYVLALMSKPTGTTLPLVLLLMDFWPLNRLSRRALLEKLPLLAVCAVSAYITIESQGRTASVDMPSQQNLLNTLLILCHNIIFYPWKMLWPVDLTSHHTFPQTISLSQPMMLAGLIGTCVLIPLLVLSLRKTRALLTGWLIFFVAIFPTVGVIGFTVVIASYKYAYLPSVGLLMILTWALGCVMYSRESEPRAHASGEHDSTLPLEVARKKLPAPVRHGPPRTSVILVIIAVTAGLAGLEIRTTRNFLWLWQDTERLYTHMLKYTPRSSVLHYHLASYLDKHDRDDEALEHCRLAIEADPTCAEAYNNWGSVLAKHGDFQGAAEKYEQAIRVNPSRPLAYKNLGLALLKLGRPDLAILQYETALRANPLYPEALLELGNTLVQLNRLEEAVSRYQAALAITPNSADLHNNLANVLDQQGHTDEAMLHYQQALTLAPDHYRAHIGLARNLVQRGQVQQAAEHLRAAAYSNPPEASIHFLLAAELEKIDLHNEAENEYRRGVELSPSLAQ